MNTPQFSEFRQKNESNFEILKLPVEVKEIIFDACKVYLSDYENTSRVDSLACLRILSRDPDYQIRLTDPSLLAILIREAGLLAGWSSPDENGILEAMKCLSNILFKNPSSCSAYLRMNGCVDGIVERCANQVISENQSDTKLTIMNFDLKVLFLLSALNVQARIDIRNRYFTSDIFVDLLAWCIKNLNSIPIVLDITIELLKFLFNLSYVKKGMDYTEISYETTYTSLTELIRSLLVDSLTLQEKQFELISHAVNFLTSIPPSCYSSLLSPQTCSNGDSPSTTRCSSDSEQQMNSRNLQALSVLLTFLDHQLTKVDSEAPMSCSSAEILTPILNVVASASKANRTIRKYFRHQILPPLGAEVKRLPESGQTIRNRLCRRLTATEKSDGVVESVALVIFVLCKESVSRAIKYSGFGNFAGFLARHGLMRGQTRSDCYSNTSSDSDTEDYLELKDRVNPVTGRVEDPRPDPMREMSEERKEYEAIELVKTIDRLQRSGFIQPGTVGEDGRVRPVEHVLELIERESNLPGGNSQRSDDDSE